VGYQQRSAHEKAPEPRREDVFHQEISCRSFRKLADAQGFKVVRESRDEKIVHGETRGESPGPSPRGGTKPWGNGGLQTGSAAFHRPGNLLQRTRQRHNEPVQKDHIQKPSWKRDCCRSVVRIDRGFAEEADVPGKVSGKEGGKSLSPTEPSRRAKGGILLEGKRNVDQKNYWFESGDHAEGACRLGEGGGQQAKLESGIGGGRQNGSGGSGENWAGCEHTGHTNRTKEPLTGTGGGCTSTRRDVRKKGGCEPDSTVTREHADEGVVLGGGGGVCSTAESPA